jgi:hypothetical protein
MTLAAWALSVFLFVCPQQIKLSMFLVKASKNDSACYITGDLSDRQYLLLNIKSFMCPAARRIVNNTGNLTDTSTVESNILRFCQQGFRKWDIEVLDLHSVTFCDSYQLPSKYFIYHTESPVKRETPTKRQRPTAYRISKDWSAVYGHSLYSNDKIIHHQTHLLVR